jgi:hypothetical protein
LRRKNRASSMNKLSTQDIGVRATTILIDRRVSGLANRSHGQGIVVKKDALMKVRAMWILASEEIVKFIWNLLKRRKINLALITAHAKKRIDKRRVGKSFSSPMKGMAKRALYIHPSKAMNLPSRIKRLMSKRNNRRM